MTERLQWNLLSPTTENPLEDSLLKFIYLIETELLQY